MAGRSCLSWDPLSQPIWGAVTKDAYEVEMKRENAEFDMGAYFLSIFILTLVYLVFCCIVCAKET